MSTTAAPDQAERQPVIPPIPLSMRLRIARTYARLEQREMAAAIGVAPGTYSGWESGNSNPRSRDLVAVAQAVEEATGVSAPWILGLVDSEGQPTRIKYATTLLSKSPPWTFRAIRDVYPQVRPRGRHYGYRRGPYPNGNSVIGGVGAHLPDRTGRGDRKASRCRRLGGNVSPWRTRPRGAHGPRAARPAGR